MRALFASSDRHDWSIEDLHSTLRRRGVAADYSSVFRAVSWLEREGVISPVSLGDGRIRHELSRRHHDHVRCESCGAVESLPSCVLERAGARVERGTGFVVTGHRLVFSGLCPACR